MMLAMILRGFRGFTCSLRCSLRSYCLSWIGYGRSPRRNEVSVNSLRKM